MIAYVTLDEGPAMLTNIVDCDPDRVAIGQRVHAVYRPTRDGTPVPMFAPDAVGLAGAPFERETPQP